jgi:tetratricopeptide (TPR) repeat protein
VMAAWALYFAFWVDPLIGAFRDWDLLAAFGLPFSIWAATTVANRYPKGIPPQWLWVPVAALGIAHSGAFVATMQDETAAALRVDRLVREDMHYTAAFFDGTRLPPWAAIVGRTLDRYDLARDHLALRVQIDPTDALAWANLGNAYRKIEMPDSAIWCYREASDRDSTNEKYANNLGVLYTERRDFPGAEYAFRRVVALSDTAYAARSSLGLVYVNEGKFDEARAMLDEAVAMRPDQFSALYNRGLLNELMADTAAAIADYESAVKSAPGFDDVYTRIVQLYQWSGQPVSAIEASQRWQGENPKSATAVFLEGTCHYMLGDYEQARKIFERVLLMKPEDALTVYYMASTYRSLGKMELALQYAQHSAQLDPKLALPHLEMVYIAADAGDTAAAVAATGEYLKRAPGDSSMAYLQQFMKH